MYGVCTVNVQMHGTVQPVSYRTNYSVSHLLDQCASSFHISTAYRPYLQLLTSAGSVLPMDEIIPFHGYKDMLTMRYIRTEPQGLVHLLG